MSTRARESDAGAAAGAEQEEGAWAHGALGQPGAESAKETVLGVMLRQRRDGSWQQDSRQLGGLHSQRGWVRPPWQPGPAS